MGLTSAMNTSLNGLQLNEVSIDVLGNNIANAGTNGFKASTVRFQTQLARTLSVGSRSTATQGGTNPRQIGLGASVSVISKDFTQGSVTNSSSPSDLAIQGNGFFILNGPNGRVYSRNGNFSLNSNSKLVNDQGMFVMGYGVDRDFNVVKTQLVPMSIPIGNLNIAQQTTSLALTGALYPAGELATQGSVSTTEVMTDTSTSAAATGTSLLSDLQNAAGDPLFTVGQDLSLAPRKGGRTVEAGHLTVTATTTVDDLMQFYSDTLGIQSGGTIPNDGVTGTQPGVTLSGGQITIVGNAGTVNDIDVTVGDLVSGASVVPLSFNKSQTANGESTGTDFVIYDSLGQPVNVRVSAILEGTNPSKTTYRYYIESPDNSGSSVALSTGTVDFDSLGRVSNGGISTFSLDRSDTAAVSPMQVTIDFTGITGISTAAAGSKLDLSSQNGAPPGTLQNFIIDESGVVNGVFDNGLIRPLGQVVLARFANPDGLIEDGSTTFKEGVSSGTPALVEPATFGVGTIRAGAIELSNTDIGKSLVDLIVASTNYRANSRVIQSVTQLVDELLQLAR
jgi:flagellar hook protein FlgE